MPRKIDAMHAYFGKNHLHRCKDCRHLISGEWNGRGYHKCEAYGLSHSEATDWRVGYTACRLYDVDLPHGHVPLIRRLKPEKEQGELKGQICMDDFFGGEEDA